MEALRLAIGDDQAADLTAHDAGHLAERDLVGELLQVEVDEVDVERDGAARIERLGDAEVPEDDLAAEDAGRTLAGEGDLLGADIEAWEIGLDLPGQLELGRLDGESPDVEVAKDEGADAGDGAGGGVEAEGRPAELEPAAEDGQAEGLDGQGVSSGPDGDIDRLEGQEGVLEFTDAQEALLGEERLGDRPRRKLSLLGQLGWIGTARKAGLPLLGKLGGSGLPARRDCPS